MPSKPPAMLKSQSTNTCLKNHSREHCHAILGGFISDLTWRKQPSMNTSSPTLTRRKCSKFNSESYGFECGTAWVSEFLSFDFTQYETQGLNLPGRATEHPGWGLIRCAVSLQFYTLLELGECLVKCHCCNLTHSAFQVRFFFFFFLRKMGTCQISQPLLWVNVLFCHCCWSNTVIQDQPGIFWKVLEALGKNMVTDPCRQTGRSISKAKSTALVKLPEC